MEIEKTPQEIAKKYWNIVRIMFHMMRQGILSKSKLIMLDLNTLVKRGKIASKSIGTLMIQHHNQYYSTLTCRPDDPNTSFVSPRAYEFSCSDTPIRRKINRQKYQKTFEISNHYNNEALSPFVTLPGFGQSPKVRQLRVTDSPFSVKDMEDHNHQVDKDAEEFIKKFYMDLKNEKRVGAVLGSPTPYHMWAR